MVNGVTVMAGLSIALPMVWFYWGLPVSIVSAVLVVVGCFVGRQLWLGLLGLVLAAVLTLRLEWEASHALPRAEQHREQPVSVCMDQPSRTYEDYQTALMRVVKQPDDLRLRQVRISAEPDMPLVPGWCLDTTLRLRQPIGRLVPGNFNATRYYFTERIDALGSLVEIHDRYPQRTLPTALYQRVKEGFDFPAALSVWAALALGWAGALDASLSEVFEQNQIKHLMVVSGMHVGMVAAWAFALSGWMLRIPGVSRNPRLIRWALVALITGAYVGLTGLGHPGVRAWTMLMIPLSAVALGFKLSASQVLAGAAVIIALIQPQAWLNTGAWLSFGLVAFLIRLSQRWRHREVAPWALAVRLQLALTALMVPVGSFLGFDWHPLSIVINLILIPTVTVLILPWSLAILIMPEWAWIPGFEYLVLHGVDLLERLAEWHESAPSWTGLEIALVAAGLWTLFSNVLTIRQRWLTLPLAAVLLLGPRTHAVPDLFRMTVLDVGHGEAIVMQWPDSTWIYDTAGQWQNGQSVASERLAGWFRRQRIEPDGILVSHADLDHAGGATWAARRWPSAARLAGDPIAVSNVSGVGGWRTCHKLSDSADRPFRVVPVPRALRTDANAHSCVIAIDTPGGRVLITGDAGRRIEYWLLQEHPELFPVAVQIIGHHGSQTSSASGFLDASPDAHLVVSSGDRASPRWPSAPLLDYLDDRQRDLTSTAERGTVTLSLADSRWVMSDWVSAYRERLLQ